MTLKLSFGGCVFDDLDANGIVLQTDADGNFTDIEEPGLSGVTVRVVDADGNAVSFFDANDAFVQSTTTDSRGFYKIFGLTEGTAYKLQFDYGGLSNASSLSLSPADVVEPSFIGQGGSEGKDSDGTLRLGPTTVETDLVVAGSAAGNKVNLGLIKPDDGPTDPGDAVIGNQVFVDANGNGRRDNGEEGLAGVQVTLTGAGADGIFGTGDDISETAITRDNGIYGFRHLDAGDYKVTFDQPDGFEFIVANAGTNEGNDSDADVNTGMTDVISLAASERNLKVDAGLVRSGDGPTGPTDAKLGNFVFLDANANGRQDAGEQGVAGVQVTLAGAGADGIFGSGDDVAAVTTTDQDGFYRFDNLAAGDYKVTFDQPDGLEFTQANVGTESGDSDADVNTGMTDVISLAASEINLKVDAGLVTGELVDPQDARLGNLVFEDTNGNGLKDSGELGVAGVQVTLAGAGADGIFGNGDDVAAVTTTNSKGNYAFKNLAAGDYKVTFGQTEGFEFTQANVGNNEGRDSDADVTTGMTEVVSLAASERNFRIDAGLVSSNAAPTASDDNATTEVGTPVSIDVLGNDADPDNDPLQVTSVEGQAIAVNQSVATNNGVVTLLANGQLSFNPNGTFVGNEVFSYHVSDGNGGEDTATVRVSVAPAPNVAPTANDDSVATAFDTSVAIDVLGNDSDPDNDPLQVTSIDGRSVVVGQSVDVGNGVVRLLDNGQLSFTSDAGFSGNESFSYHVSDGNGGEDTATVNVNVAPRPNSAPDANNDSVTTAFDTPVTIDVLGNDSDPDNDPLQVTSIDGRSVVVGQSVDVGNGVVRLLDNGQLSFTSDSGFSGNESFSYHVSDGNGGEDTATVNVTVDRAPNNAPVHTGEGQFYLVTDAYRGGGNDNPGRELVVDLSRIVEDPDGDPLTYRLNFANTRREEGNSGQAGQLGYDVKSFDANTGRLVFQIYTEYRETWANDKQEGSDLGFFSFTATDDRGASKDAFFEVEAYDQGPRTPLALDLNGDGVQTLSIAEGIRFDILNTGTAVNTGWLSAEDGFLAVDNNGDGLITSRDELLGGASQGDGFAKLATFDSNGDGWVNAQDSAFTDLSVWQDANSNGVTDAGELTTLASHGITDLNTSYTDVFSTDAQGNIIGEVSSARTDSGNISLVDVYFQVGA